MSNGESKIAESKAALCYGFAIALRALFLGILRFYCHCERPLERVAIKHVKCSWTFDCFAYARSDTSTRHCSEQHASVAINEQQIPKRIPTRLLATRLKPLAMTQSTVSSVQRRLIATLALAITRRTSDMRDYFTNPAARTLLNAAA